MNETDIRAMLNLYFIAGTQDCRHLPDGTPQQKLLAVLELALQNGITCFQFREKGAGALRDPAEIRALAETCRDLCRRYNVPFFLNNDVRLALELQADGVHIGQKDMPLPEAAALCKGRLVLGISNTDMAELDKNRDNPDVGYFAAGPVFATRSKADAAPPTGIGFIRDIRASGFTRPLAAIGGITADSAADIRRAGADGIAVISAITQAQDIARAVQGLLAR
ncbi:thiamine phosphate synthase [Neisseria sp.]|uniref:thiamine phosphate synthase n=1 Tax=Neisseria sp. TaxID=192066 RepID=UPI00359FF8D4